MSSGNRFPGGKKFAFTIFDDTDGSTLENSLPVYGLLDELGLRTTKSVWALDNVPGAEWSAGTLQDREYLEWVLRLQESGFEIASHGVRNSHSTRATVRQGLCEYARRLGSVPRAHANHNYNLDNLYWGDARVSSRGRRLLYNLATRFRYRRVFEGHLPHSDYFWGDLCRQQIAYVRSFVFHEINLDRIGPFLPYHDPLRPYVNYWFISSEGGNVRTFCRTLSEANQDRLEEEGGVCVMYTHFALGFQEERGLNSRFGRLMRRLAQKNGWFVPVSTLLDFLREERPREPISVETLASLERHWLYERLRHGSS